MLIKKEVIKNIISMRGPALQLKKNGIKQLYQTQYNLDGTSTTTITT